MPLHVVDVLGSRSVFWHRHNSPGSRVVLKPLHLIMVSALNRINLSSLSSSIKFITGVVVWNPSRSAINCSYIVRSAVFLLMTMSNGIWKKWWWNLSWTWQWLAQHGQYLGPNFHRNPHNTTVHRQRLWGIYKFPRNLFSWFNCWFLVLLACESLFGLQRIFTLWICKCNVLLCWLFMKVDFVPIFSCNIPCYLVMWTFNISLYDPDC